jgi:hypothetical protein
MKGTEHTMAKNTYLMRVIVAIEADTAYDASDALCGAISMIRENGDVVEWSNVDRGVDFVRRAPTFITADEYDDGVDLRDAWTRAIPDPI